LKCDGTRADTRFRLSAKRTSPFKSAGASVQSTTDSRGVRISGSNAGYTMFRGSVKSTGYPLHCQFPFTSPPVCHRVPSHLNWTVLVKLYIAACVSKVSLYILCNSESYRYSSEDEINPDCVKQWTAVEQWLRRCTTNRKIAGSIPAGVSRFFIDIKSFRSYYGPGVDSASNRNEYQVYFLGVKAAGA